MKKINQSPEWNNCLHPNGAPGELCPACNRECSCTLGGTLVRTEMLLPPLGDGMPDLGALPQHWGPIHAMPLEGYFCRWCRRNFMNWEDVLDHIRRGTIG